MPAHPPCLVVHPPFLGTSGGPEALHQQIGAVCGKLENSLEVYYFEPKETLEDEMARGKMATTHRDASMLNQEQPVPEERAVHHAPALAQD